jgi:peptidoglycan/LPS O-acetylase OafA/YrhL
MDGLRFVAIAMVVLFHLNGYLMAKASFYEHGLAGPDWLCRSAMAGFHGVELFFVISGFILALPFAAHHLADAPAVNLRKYFLRRLTRLEPPYFVTIFLLIFLSAVMRQGPQPALYSHLAASLAYVHNLVYEAPSTVIGVAWSLEIEVQFYLLVPLLTLVFAIRRPLWRRALLAGAVFVTVAGQSVFLQHYPRFALSILGYLQFFLIGFLLADVFLANSVRRNFYWDLFAFAGWPLLWLLLQSRLFTLWLFPWALLALCCAAFRGRWVNHVFRNSWLTAVGGMCYSVYLIHYEVISAVARFTKPLGRGLPNPLYLLAQFALVGASIVLVCTFYFLLLEKPCMRRDWPQQLWQYSADKCLLLRNLSGEKVLRSGLSRP